MQKKILLIGVLLSSLVVYAQNPYQANLNSGAFIANQGLNGGGYKGLYQGALSSFGNSISSVPNFNSRPQTIGSEYIFDNWVQGILTDNNGKVFADGYLFNFNKVNQNVYFRLKDTGVAFIVNRSQVRSIILVDGDKKCVLQKLSSGVDDNFYRELIKGKNYSLYSLNKTQFVAANYFTNGFTSSGSLYDEFKDALSYYIVFPDGSRKEIDLKKKAVKKFFAAEKQKVDMYFKRNVSPGVFNEESLKGLVQNLND